MVGYEHTTHFSLPCVQTICLNDETGKGLKKLETIPKLHEVVTVLTNTCYLVVITSLLRGAGCITGEDKQVSGQCWEGIKWRGVRE